MWIGARQARGSALHEIDLPVIAEIERYDQGGNAMNGQPQKGTLHITTKNLAVGLAAGLVLAVILVFATDSIGLGVALGMGMGVLLGVSLGKLRAESPATRAVMIIYWIIFVILLLVGVSVLFALK